MKRPKKLICEMLLVKCIFSSVLGRKQIHFQGNKVKAYGICQDFQILLN